MGTGKCRRWKHWLGAICLILLSAAAAPGQTQGVSVRATNGNAVNITGFDNSGTKSINSNTRQLFDSSAGLSVGWQSRQAFDSSQATSVDWGNRVLDDNSVTPSLDWQNRLLRNSSGSTILNFQTGNGTNLNSIPGTGVGIYPGANITLTTRADNGVTIASSITTLTNMAAGVSNNVALGSANTNGLDFNGGVNLDVNGTNRIQAGNGPSNVVALLNALGTNALTVGSSGNVGIGTNYPLHALDVTAAVPGAGNAGATNPVMEVYKASNGADNTHVVLRVNCTLADIPAILLGNFGDGVDFTFQRNGVVGGDHLLINLENSTRGIALFGDGHMELQGTAASALLVSGSGAGIAQGLSVGTTNNTGVSSGNIWATGTLFMGGVASNKVVTSGTYGVPTVFASSNVLNTTSSVTLGGIGTAPNLGGHSTTCELLGTVQISSATTATLTVTWAWNDEAGTAQTTNIFPATTINGSTDISLIPVIITTQAGTAVKVSTTLTGTSTYSLHTLAEALVNN